MELLADRNCPDKEDGFEIAGVKGKEFSIIKEFNMVVGTCNTITALVGDSGATCKPDIEVTQEILSKIRVETEQVHVFFNVKDFLNADDPEVL